MDLTWSESEEAFRAEVREWLEANVPAEPLPSGDTEEGFRLHREWEKKLFDARYSVVSWPEEYGGRGASLGVADLRRGVLPGRRPAAGQPERHLPARAHHLRVRHRRAEGALPAADGRGRRAVGPGLVRAQRRQRPGRDQEPGDAGRRRLAGERPEDLGHARRVLHPPLRPVPHRSRGRAPPGAELPAGPARRRGGHRAGRQPARRRRGLRRGVLRRRVRPRRGRAGRRERGLAGGHGDHVLRARPDAAQPRPVHGGGGPADRPLPPRRARRPTSGWPTRWSRPGWTPRPTSSPPSRP